MKQITIGIIGDYDGRPSHLATNSSIEHSGDILGIQVTYEWIPTKLLENKAQEMLHGYCGLWCAPGSPYQSMNGALEGIRFARENHYPFIGTCGGFQHAVLEYARNVLNLAETKAVDFDLYSENPYITALSCSLVGQSKKIILDKKSILYEIYQKDEVFEKYNCNFGLAHMFQQSLEESGFKTAGVDQEGDARILYIPDSEKRFNIITLFQPQLSSTPEHPHPLITKFLEAASEFKKLVRE